MQAQATPPLKNELQLGQRLNSAITETRRGEFGLLLAMLSQDARDMAQFEFKSDDLKDKFELSKTPELIADFTKESIQDNSNGFHHDGFTDFRLLQSLNPEALVTRGEHALDEQLVLQNCGVLAVDNFNDVKTPKLELQIPHLVDRINSQIRALT